MAGFLGFGNYAKPGKGVKKNGPQKKKFFQFFEVYFRKFGKLIQLNLIYVLFCIPIITIGPATVAMTKIARCFIEEKPVFLFSDFWDAFKSNFKQGLVIGLLDGLVTYCIIVAYIFYFQQALANNLYWLLLGVMTAFTLIFVFANFYIYLMTATVNLKVLHLIKNAFLLAFLGMKTNFITFFFTALLVVPTVLFFPLTIPVMLVILYSTVTMITAFNSFQYIYKYMIRPYYFTNGLPDPYEEKEEETPETAIFEDMT